jgi:tetratricopeptide (TPR) repeat protein
VQPAYEAYDEANQLASQDKLKEAQQKLDKALAIEPRESLFHALQGDIHAQEEKWRPALSAYTRAIDANPGLFYGYLRRGQVEYRRNQSDTARPDLEKSLELMPTAEAHYLLGMLDKTRGETAKAVQHFQSAANSQSASGQKARGELVRMDLPQNPARYVPSKAVVDKSNIVWAVFANQSGLDLKNIEVSFAWRDDAGRTRSSKTLYRGPLPNGKQDNVRLGIQLNSAAEIDERVLVEVTAAQIAE